MSIELTPRATKTNLNAICAEVERITSRNPLTFISRPGDGTTHYVFNGHVELTIRGAVRYAYEQLGIAQYCFDVTGDGEQIGTSLKALAHGGEVSAQSIRALERWVANRGPGEELRDALFGVVSALNAGKTVQVTAH